MSGTFFRSLNPNSKSTGLFKLEKKKKQDFYGPSHYLSNTEIIDVTLMEELKKVIKMNKLNFFDGLVATFRIIYGAHYDVDNCLAYDGQKGVLDFLLFPLISRALQHHTMSVELAHPKAGWNSTRSLRNPGEAISNLLMFSIVFSLEAARFSAALALTLLLIPVVTIIHCIKYLSPIEINQTSMTP
ncbi:MAG: hypothetical protein WC627_11830 [Legionella sp.]|jgi:hypothetical protein